MHSHGIHTARVSAAGAGEQGRSMKGGGARVDRLGNYLNLG